MSLKTKYIFNIYCYFVKPREVEGHLDNLIGQQINMCLFLMVICLILLFIFYIINNIFLYNREIFQKFYRNRIILCYIQDQIFVTKLT